LAQLIRFFRPPRRVLAALAAGGLTLAVTGVLAQRSLLDGARIDGMHLISSEGQTVVQEFFASESTVDADGVSILSRDVRILVHNPDTGKTVEVTSPFARYYYAAGEKERSDLVDAGDLGADAAVLVAGVRIVRFEEKLAGVANAGRGDFLLVDPSGKGEIEVDFGEDGSLTARELFWSEAEQRFICPGHFRQQSNVPDGSFTIEGPAFVADRSFSDLWYPAIGDTPVSLDFQGTTP
jgi:hypothetical protein